MKENVPLETTFPCVFPARGVLKECKEMLGDPQGTLMGPLLNLTYTILYENCKNKN